MAFFATRNSTQKFLVKKITGNIKQIAKISEHERNIIGKREILGYGWNGQPGYADRSMFPFPSVRFKEPTPELEALHEKEKGDWNELTCEEKKTLYRASFCQTYAEFQISNKGEWKSILGTVLLLCCPSLWLYIYFKKTIYAETPYPESFKEENREAQFRRILDLKMNPVQGIAARWDYQKDDWKNPNDSWKSKSKPKKC